MTKLELLPVPYFHVVFTLPEDLNALERQDHDRSRGGAWRVLAASTILART